MSVTIRYPSSASSGQSPGTYEITTPTPTIRDLVAWARGRADQRIPTTLPDNRFLVYEFGRIEPGTLNPRQGTYTATEPAFRKVLDSADLAAVDRTETTVALEGGKIYELLPVKFLVSVEIEGTGEQNIFGVGPNDSILPDLVKRDPGQGSNAMRNYVVQALVAGLKREPTNTGELVYEMKTSLGNQTARAIFVSPDTITVENLPEGLPTYGSMRLTDELVRITLTRLRRDPFEWPLAVLSGVLAGGLVAGGGAYLYKIQRSANFVDAVVRSCAPLKEVIDDPPNKTNVAIIKVLGAVVGIGLIVAGSLMTHDEKYPGPTRLIQVMILVVGGLILIAVAIQQLALVNIGFLRSILPQKLISFILILLAFTSVILLFALPDERWPSFILLLVLFPVVILYLMSLKSAGRRDKESALLVGLVALVGLVSGIWSAIEPTAMVPKYVFAAVSLAIIARVFVKL